jgi:dipeptidyl aminopeptidase/acylaminoacyl peptidase
VGFNGGYDLVNRGRSRWPSDRLLEKFLGKVTPERLKEASAIYQIKSPPPDTLLLHGDADATIDCEVAKRFAKAIRAKGGRAVVKIFAGEQHGFFNPGRPKYEECFAALEEHLMRVFNLTPADK